MVAPDSGFPERVLNLLFIRVNGKDVLELVGQRPIGGRVSLDFPRWYGGRSHWLDVGASAPIAAKWVRVERT